MKTYNEFKEILIRDIKNYLPDLYKNWNVSIRFTPKVNGFLETLLLEPDENEYVIPNIYINDFFDYYKETGNIEKAVNSAADFFLEGIKNGQGLKEKSEEAMTKENIIMTLINTDSNKELLEKCPHRDFLDLSIIYRWIMELPDGSFNCAILMGDLEKKFDLDEEDLYMLALANTQKKFPPVIEELADDFSIITNKRFVHGATVILYKDQLKKVASKMNADLYILPSSIHEVIAIPDNNRNPKELLSMVEEANREVVEDKDILSNAIYHYDMISDKLSVVKDVTSFC